MKNHKLKTAVAKGIANAKGWSSILQRAEYSRRFKEAEEMGLKCVLIYCGDHDPDGLRISDTIRKNLEQIQEVQWKDGTEGYDPSNLIIDRIGLNFDFIQSNGYTWIEITSSQDLERTWQTGGILTIISHICRSI